jgi:hypothetical protein
MAISTTMAGACAGGKRPCAETGSQRFGWGQAFIFLITPSHENELRGPTRTALMLYKDNPKAPTYFSSFLPSTIKFRKFLNEEKNVINFHTFTIS